MGCIATAGFITSSATPQIPASPYVVSEQVHTPPKHLKKHKRFRPPARAAGGKLIRIANREQRRWGGPSIVGRLRCESGLRSWATNGTYHGAAQFGPIWWSMWPGTPRDVKVRSVRIVKRPITRTRLWSDGERGRKRIGTRRQRQVIIKRGMIPRGANQFHAYANVRVAQRAVSGSGATTSWACPL